MRFVSLVSSFFLCASFQLTIDGDKLKKKLEEPIPPWMEEQISEDLEAFIRTGVSADCIERTIQEVDALPTGYAARFVRYQIIDNKISCWSLRESLTADPVAHFMAFFQAAARYVRFPDVDFLLSTWDDYDNASYLEHTYCPVFCISKMQGNPKVVLIPWLFYYNYKQMQMQGVHAAAPFHPWGSKIPIAFWRGATSGNYYPWCTWDFKVRPRLVLFSQERPDLIDAAFTSVHFLDDALKSYFDQYDFFRPYLHAEQHLPYKYLVAADGNAFPGSFQWQLLSNSVVLRHSSPFSEWFYKALVPYEHYVPYATDLSDLEEKIVWLRAHDEEAKKIAETSTQFALENLMIEDVILYYYKLLSAYAALQRG